MMVVIPTVVELLDSGVGWTNGELGNGNRRIVGHSVGPESYSRSSENREGNKDVFTFFETLFTWVVVLEHEFRSI